MRYFIYENQELKEVTDEEYNSWALPEELKLPDIEIEHEGFLFSLEMMFYGCFDEYDGLYPWVLICFKDELQIGKRRIIRKPLEHEEEYFATYGEMFLRREKLIKEMSEGTFLN